MASGARCERHAAERERERLSPSRRGYGRRWQHYSEQYLREHPICADPFGDHGERETASECVDHIIPHKGDMELFLDPANHQPLCIPCNSKKAVLFEGGFGR